MKRNLIVCVCVVAACALLVAGRYVASAGALPAVCVGQARVATATTLPVRFVDNGMGGTMCAYDASLKYSASKLESPACAKRLIVDDRRSLGTPKPVPMGGEGPTTSSTCANTCTNTCAGATCDACSCPKYDTCQSKDTCNSTTPKCCPPTCK